MTDRKPLVLIDGVIAQLPNGDSINAELSDMTDITEVDFVDDTTIYKGWAKDEDTALSDPAWRIQLIEFVGADEDIRTRWAGNDSGYVHVWNDRANPTNWS